jgi:hypothetical protein
MIRLKKIRGSLCGIIAILIIIICSLLPSLPAFASDNMVLINPSTISVDNGDDFSVYLDLSIGDTQINTVGFQLDWSGPSGTLQCNGISLATGAGSFFEGTYPVPIQGSMNQDTGTTTQYSWSLFSGYIQGPKSGHVAVISFHALADGEVTILPCDVQLALEGNTVACDVVYGTVTIGGERSSGGGTETNFPEATDDVNFVRVDKPFSVNPGGAGYQLQTGTTVRHSPGDITEIIGPDNKVIGRARDSDAELVPTPSGITRATHIFQVPDKAMIINTDGVIKVYSENNLILTIINEDPQPPAEDPRRWIEWAGTSLPVSVDHFCTQWTVPISPNNQDKLNYIFNGIEPFNGGSIIQPVLQWNRWSVYPNSWSCNTYYVTSEGEQLLGIAFVADEGDLIWGQMDWVDNPPGGSPSGWSISMINVTTGESTNIYVSELGATWDQLFLTLEGGAINYTNGDVCGTVQFTDIECTSDGVPVGTTWHENINSTYFPQLTGLQVDISMINPTTCTLYTDGGINPTVGLSVIPVNKADIILSNSIVAGLPILILIVLSIIMPQVLPVRRVRIEKDG